MLETQFEKPVKEPRCGDYTDSAKKESFLCCAKEVTKNKIGCQ